MEKNVGLTELINKPALCCETGLDESYLVGTKEELENFANAILQLLDSPDEIQNYHGVKTKNPTPYCQ